MTSSEALFSFVQTCQAAAGAWAGSANPILPVRAAWGVLDAVPLCGHASERAVVARVLESLSRHLLRKTWRYRYSQALPEAPATQHAAAALLAILDTYSDERLSLRVVAERLSISPCHLSHVLKTASGYGFAAHVNRCRTLAAVQFIRGRQCRIKEVAWRVGYATAPELDRQFALLLRMTPTELKELPSSDCLLDDVIWRKEGRV